MVALLRGLIFASTSITRIQASCGNPQRLGGQVDVQGQFHGDNVIAGETKGNRYDGRTESPLAVRDEKSIAPPFGNEIGILTGARTPGSPPCGTSEVAPTCDRSTVPPDRSELENISNYVGC